MENHIIRIRLEIIGDPISLSQTRAVIDQVENPDQFYQAAMAFGKFSRIFLADYPADTLFETIEGFHDTKARFEFF